MSKEKRRVPNLRFPGFTEDWEQRKLGSIGSTYTGLSGKTKEDFGHGEAQYITYLNVFQNTISNITMTDKVEIDPTQNEVKYGDVLFTTSSETPEEVGMSSVWLGDTPNIYLNSFCFGFRPNQKIDSYFLGYSLRAPYMRDKIKILAQGISRYNISKNKVMELEISLPNNEEQKLLGTFLQRIDFIITLHQRKLDNLKLKKKALLQKLFPKNGERYPELRFPGFTDAWEQRKLSDILKVNSGKDYKHLDQGNIPVYGTGGYMLSVNESLSNIDAIGIGRKGTIDKPQYLKAPFWTVDTLFYLTALSKHSILFLYYLMQLIPWKKFDESTGVPSLSKTTIDNINGYVPSYSKEEESISALFNQLDKSITLHQRKLDHLQLQKKALLQQMFV